MCNVPVGFMMGAMGAAKMYPSNAPLQPQVLTSGISASSSVPVAGVLT